MNPLKEKLENLSGGRILDIGTSEGGFIKFLTESLKDYEHITGIDISEERLQKAGESFDDDRIEFDKMNAADLRFDDNSFDIVAMNFTLHHLDNAQQSLFEMKRVLKPDGLFILNEMFRNKGLSPDNSHHHIHHWYVDVDKIFGVPHHMTFYKNGIIDVVSRLNLKDVEYTEHQDPPIEPGKNEVLDGILAKCNSYIDKIKDKPELSDLVERGQYLVEMLEESGCTLDPVLYITGKK